MRRVAKAQAHTEDELVEYLTRLAIIATKAELTDREYEILAPTILQLLGAGQVLFEQADAGAVLLDGLRTPGH